MNDVMQRQRISAAVEYAKLKREVIGQIKKLIGKDKYMFDRPVRTPEYPSVLGLLNESILTADGWADIGLMSLGSLRMIRGMLERKDV